MRLSEMNNDVCIEKVIEITPYLGEIMQDEELISIFYDRLDITDMDEKEGKIKGLAKGVSNFTKLIPILLKKHKENIYSVLAIVNDKTVEEIRKQNPVQTIKQLKELWSDKELLNF